MAAATDRNVAARGAITGAVLTALEPLWFTREVLRTLTASTLNVRGKMAPGGVQDLWRAERGYRHG